MSASILEREMYTEAIAARLLRVAPSTPHYWLEGGNQGWLIVTRDSRIGENRGEMAAVRDDGAKMVALSQKDAATKWGQLEVFMTRWRDIEALTRAGPVHLARVAHGADADSPRLTAAPPSASQLS